MGERAFEYFLKANFNRKDKNKLKTLQLIEGL
jgi:hypothetical protein